MMVGCTSAVLPLPMLHSQLCHIILHKKLCRGFCKPLAPNGHTALSVPRSVPRSHLKQRSAGPWTPVQSWPTELGLLCMNRTMQQSAARLPTTGRRVVFKNEGIGRQRLQSIILPSNVTYGVELEGFYPSNVDVSTLQSALSSVGRSWRVKNDSSIVCNPRVPSCYRAELVSPVLRGTEGLDNIFGVMNAVKRHNPSVNKTTGLHVHVGVDGGWQLPQLKRLAYNFVQLESALDLLVPKSRRHNNNQYCRSNVTALTTASSRTKQQALQLIQSANSTPQLQQLLCPGESRYMKMNLMALNRHGTVEFRHAGGCKNPAKVVGYVLLWTLLAEASLTNRPLATMPKKGYAFENLLKFYGASPVLTHWLPRRRLELNPKSTNNAVNSARGSTGGARGTQGHASGCGCNDCRR